MEIESNNNIVKENNVNTSLGCIMITPSINKDYWAFRVKMYKDQYIQAFPKFGTIGIGFAIEDDWNTNLPYVNTTAEEIYDHIKHNKKYDEIKKEDCIKAIEMLRQICAKYMDRECEV